MLSPKESTNTATKLVPSLNLQGEVVCRELLVCGRRHFMGFNFFFNIPVTCPLVFQEEDLILPKGLLKLLWETGAPFPSQEWWALTTTNNFLQNAGVKLPRPSKTESLIKISSRLGFHFYRIYFIAQLHFPLMHETVQWKWDYFTFHY